MLKPVRKGLPEDEDGGGEVSRCRSSEGIKFPSALAYLWMHYR